MTQTIMSARRIADALLYNAGVRSVKLRIPAPATGGDTAEQLGLAVPQFQDLDLSPAAFRNAAAKSNSKQQATRDLLVAASAIQALTSADTFGSADALFASSFGVLVDDVLLTIVSSTELEAAGEVYAYRLTLREAIADAP